MSEFVEHFVWVCFIWGLAIGAVAICRLLVILWVEFRNGERVQRLPIYEERPAWLQRLDRRVGRLLLWLFVVAAGYLLIAWAVLG